MTHPRRTAAQRPEEEPPDDSRASVGGAAVEELRRDIAALIERSPTSATLNVIALCDVTSSVLVAVPSRRQAFRLWGRFAWVTLRDGVLRWRFLGAVPPSSVEATRARTRRGRKW